MEFMPTGSTPAPEMKGRGAVFGTTTMSEKGQVVIPAEARKALGLEKSDKLLVFSMGGEMLALVKLTSLERFTSHMAGRLETIRKAMSQATDSESNTETQRIEETEHRELNTKTLRHEGAELPELDTETQQGNPND